MDWRGKGGELYPMLHLIVKDWLFSLKIKNKQGFPVSQIQCYTGGSNKFNGTEG